MPITVLADPTAPTTRPGTTQPAGEQAQIDLLVLNLGNANGAAREKASRELWTIGKPAEAALRLAAAGDDPEIASRARTILRDFKLGISPDAPPAVLENIRAYQQGNAAERIRALRGLAALGRDGIGAVLKLYAGETDANSRQTILAQLRAAGQQTSARAAMAAGEMDIAEALLEGGARSTNAAARDYAAWLLVRGRLGAKIAELEAAEGNDLLLVAMYRARAEGGDLGQAKAILSRSKDEWDQAGIWYEAKQWDKLAALFEPPNRRAEEADGRNLRIGLRYLAGDKNATDAAVTSAKEWLKTHPDDPWFTVKALLLVDRREEAYTMLRERKMYSTLFTLLRAQGRFAEALQLPAEAKDATAEERVVLLAEVATLLAKLGEPEQAREVVDLAYKLAESGHVLPQQVADDKPKPDAASPLWATARLAKAEAEIGQDERSRSHLLMILGRLAPDRKASVVDGLYPQKNAQAGAWWMLLQQAEPSETDADRLDRVMQIMSGKVEPQAVAEWAKAGPAIIAGQKSGYVADRLASALADSLLSIDRRGQAEACLVAAGEATKSGVPWQKLGDLSADAGDWPKALDRYSKAAERAPDNAASLYLRGYALTKTGRAEEGKSAIQQAKLLPLADAYARTALADVMEARGDTAAAKEQRDLIPRISEPGIFSQSQNLRRTNAQQEAKLGHFLPAADDMEQSCLPIFRTSSGFIDTSYYVITRFFTHAWRARGLAEKLEAGKGDASTIVEQANAALDALQADIDLPIKLIPVLEAKGQKEAAEALFLRSWAYHEQISRDYPRYAQGHNNAAWLASQCGRELPAALIHAERAVQLSPDNPAFIDTEAEVLFRLGRKAEAAERMKRCLELDPKREYFQTQLKRFDGRSP